VPPAGFQWASLLDWRAIDMMTSSESDERGAKVHFPPPLVFAGFTLLGAGLQYIAPIPFLASAWMKIIGIIVLLGGLALMIAAVKEFRRTGQDPKPWKPSPELVLQGPYLFTRNPMYVGFTIVQIGLGVALGTLWISLLAPVALLVVHFIAVVPEEKYLEEKFADSYREYRRRVRRYV
jgi:protein-S-isoprenylcysteine O-methyltransferase Ste14